MCLSGCFWEDEATCRPSMDQAVTERHLDWIDARLRPLLLRAIVLNSLTRRSAGGFRNTTFVIAEDMIPELSCRCRPVGG